jgi:medium-chain acyl-[acyl-carrier-protein] hydrolase
MVGKWAVCYVPREAASLRLLCFPYAGAGASIYRAWAALLPPEIELWAIQMPGREHRMAEPPRHDLMGLVEEAQVALRPLLDSPFALFGHSLGALQAFEFARALRRHQAPGPRHLFVSARRAPQHPSMRPAMYLLPEREFWNELARYGGIPQILNDEPELREIFYPILSADFALFETYLYRQEAPLLCPITALGGREDPTLDPEDLAAWRIQTDAAFDMRFFSGDHFFWRNDPSPVIGCLAQALCPVALK